MSSITWFGHSAFRLRCGDASVLIDPFFTAPEQAKAAQEGGVDLVLVTHDHGDHVGDAVAICRKSGATLGAVVGTAEKLAAKGVPGDRVLSFNMGGTVSCKGVSVTMVPAYHTSESGSPVGYIITMPDGLTVYHAGDTSIFSGMALWGKLYKIDVALLPIGGWYTMDARQAAMACGLLKCQSVVPMHWGTFPVLAQSTDAFAEELKTSAPACTLIGMLPGDTVELSR
ncbi:MAG: metal-dependent hydrolase [Comamonadaceae bacterium]|nr:metal-dependent hydrolase [Comamonadaceae bacterium]